MEADEVDPAAVAVVGVEFGRVPVGERAELQIGGRSRPAAEGAEAVGGPVRPLAPDGVLQRRVGIVEIDVDELDRLVDDLVRHGAISVQGRASAVVADRVRGVHFGVPLILG